MLPTEQHLTRRGFIKASAAAAVAAPAAGCVDFADVPTNIAVPNTPVPKPSPFNRDSTAMQVTAGLDLTGKTILITGCNSGIGYETMRVLCARGAHVLGTGRTFAKAAEACASVEGPGHGKATPLECELTDFTNVAACAAQVNNMGIPVDVLILNAGVMALQELEQVDINGTLLEKHFVVNHLGHFVLANQLIEPLKAAPAARVVSLSSAAAYMWGPEAGIEFDNLSGERDYNWRLAYGQSKLANALFAREFARRLHVDGNGSRSAATVNSVHPGGIATNIKRHMPDYQQWLVSTFGGLFMKSMEQGAATTCYVATSPQLEGVTGYFFANCNPSYPGEYMEDDVMAGELWRVSEGLV